MTITAPVYGYKKDAKYFSVKVKGRLCFFYMQTSHIKKFGRYLYKGRFISFEYDESKRKKIGRVFAYPVLTFIKIIKNGVYAQEVYYDIGSIQLGIKNLVNSLENLMFLDFELSMNDFGMPENFVAEIIQAGIIITDKSLSVKEKIYLRIKPSVFKLSKRTKKFLTIDMTDLKTWIPYQSFYLIFRDLISKYNPSILVWGKNDIIALKESYELNKVLNLEDKTIFINLLQLIKNYYNAKNDIGLFRAYEVLTRNEVQTQIHDALEDANITMEVFRAFRKLTNKKYSKIIFDNIKSKEEKNG